MHRLHYSGRMTDFFRNWRQLASYEPLANPFAWISFVLLVYVTTGWGLGAAPIVNFLHFLAH